MKKEQKSPVVNGFEVVPPELTDKQSNYLLINEQSVYVFHERYDCFRFTDNRGQLLYQPQPGPQEPKYNKIQIHYLGVTGTPEPFEDGALLSFYDFDGNLIELESFDHGYDIHVYRYHRGDGDYQFKELLVSTLGYVTTLLEPLFVTFQVPVDPDGSVGVGMSIYTEVEGSSNPVKCYEDTVDSYSFGTGGFCIGARTDVGSKKSNKGARIFSAIASYDDSITE